MKSLILIVIGSALINNVFDRDANTFDVIAADHVISISGQNIQMDPAQDDEGAWLVKRRHIGKRKHAYEPVARACIRKSDFAWQRSYSLGRCRAANVFWKCALVVGTAPISR